VGSGTTSVLSNPIDMSLEAFLSIGNAIVHYYAYYHKQQRFSLDDSEQLFVVWTTRLTPQIGLKGKKGK
jgi:hypothetical protein